MTADEATAVLKDGDAIRSYIDEVMAVVGPPFADVRAINSERQQVSENRRLSPSGRSEELERLEAKSAEAGVTYTKGIREALTKKREEVRQTEDAADRGLEPHGSGFVAREHVTLDPVQVALDGEARAELRKMPPDVFRSSYQKWVQADHRLARVAEADPLGALVTPQLREWSRQHRIANSPLLPRIQALRAQERSLSLALTWLEMEFGVRHSEPVDAA